MATALLFIGATASASPLLCDALKAAGAVQMNAVYRGDAAFEGCLVGSAGGQNYACRWAFEHGNPTSRERYADLRLAITACPDAGAPQIDAGVNHPDYYDAVTVPFADFEARVSIKDKSALDKTFVTLFHLRPEAN